jgi:hypothetical protein
MWTDINTKLKQVLVFHVFQGHVMGIPAHYWDADYKGKVPIFPKVLILPFNQGTASIAEVCWRKCKKGVPQLRSN